MNRKAKAKTTRKAAESAKVRQSRVVDIKKTLHPFDIIENWLMGDFREPPWTPEQIRSFQDRLDSAFEAPNGIVLVWSGDRRYGDVFLNENGDIERKPPLLFAEIPVEGTKDYVYVAPPRWLLMETIHGSQLEAGWDAASIMTDNSGVQVRIRPEKPPEFMYQHFKLIAEHEQATTLGEFPPCCVRMGNRICYGKYREPSDADIALVGETRQRMNRAGAVQRNDEERTRKVLMDGTAATKHFIKRAREQQAMRVKEIMLANAESFFGDLPAKLGTTKSFKELEHIFKGALDRQDEQRFQ